MSVSRRWKAKASSTCCSRTWNNRSFHIRWQWSAGDAVLWDNRCTAHYPINNYSEPRALCRVTIYER
ncbi:MAG: hypothetical protein FJY55_04155 [Betaproteobacteria bacterium]|nr:hypothetical protein [Betaproteobacteria bacterium]